MEEVKYAIYIVDDSKIITEIMKKIISTIPGVSATDFKDGETFFNRLAIKQPDMIFLDYYLTNDHRQTGMNGEEIFVQLKLRYPEIPVVMLTGIGDPEKLDHFKRIGFSDVICKAEDDIFKTILSCIHRFIPVG